MVPTSSKPAMNAAESPKLARFLSWIKPKASHRSISCINGGSSSLLSASHLAMCFIFTCAFQLSRRGRGKGGSAYCIRACCFETLSNMRCVFDRFSCSASPLSMHNQLRATWGFLLPGEKGEIECAGQGEHHDHPQVAPVVPVEAPVLL